MLYWNCSLKISLSVLHEFHTSIQYIHIIFYSPLPSLTSLDPFTTLSTSCPLFCDFWSLWVQLAAAHICVGLRLPVRTQSSLLPLEAINSQKLLRYVRRAHVSLSYPYWPGLILCGSPVGNHSCHEFNSPIIPRRRYCLVACLDIWLLYSFHLVSHDALSASREVCDIGRCST